MRTVHCLARTKEGISNISLFSVFLIGKCLHKIDLMLYMEGAASLFHVVLNW